MSLWRRTGTLLAWLAWPALFVYLRIGSRSRVIVIAEDHLLLVQGWLSTPSWGLPGGGLHRRESLALGAVREVREETGLHLAPEQLTSLTSEWLTENGITFHCHFLAARLPRRIELHRQRGEIVAAEWVPLAQVPTLPLKTDVRRALELLAATR